MSLSGIKGLKGALISQAQVKIMLIYFLITRALLTFSFLKNAKKCINIVIWKCWQGYMSLFVGEDHNFTCAHDLLAVQEFLAKKSILKFDHLP